jgi:hypothetical protein
MSTALTIEQRLEAVEHAIADIQGRLVGNGGSGHWLDRVTGSITDEPAFREVLELGRAIRWADRPAESAHDEP